MACEYFVRSWKMCPTSMPRTMSSFPLPSGLGSPATTLRMSATCGSGRSRPQFTPVRWKPSSFAPQTKSLINATRRSATTFTSFARTGRGRFGEFHVGGVVRLRAEGDRVFAGVGEDMEFVRAGTADRAGVGGHGAELQPQAREDARIGVVHVAVFAREILVVGVERIAVLHDEFARAHDA